MWDERDESRLMRLAFGELAWDLFDLEVSHRRCEPSELTRDACLAFGDRLFSGRFSCDVPRFRERGALGREIELTLPQRVWTDLQLEAGRQGIELETLIEHALILRLAEPEGWVRRWRRGSEASGR